MPVAGCGSREKRACAGEFLFFLFFFAARLALYLFFLSMLDDVS